MSLSETEALVARAVRPDLVDKQYALGDDVDVDISLQYPSPTGHARVVADSLRVRIQPSPDTLVIGSLAVGDEVDVWGSVGDWSLVRKGKVYGWSATRYLERV